MTGSKKLSVKRKSGSKAEKISSIARPLFVQKGYSNVSVDEIARKSRVSKPTIYAHFGGKERLFLSILEETFVKIEAPLIGEGIEELPFEEVLLKHALSYTRSILTPDIQAINRLLVAEAVRWPELARRYYHAGPAAAHEAVAEFLQKRVDAGEIQCEDCLSAARMYAAMVINPTRLRMHLMVLQTPDWDEVDRQTKMAVRIFTAGLKYSTTQ